ncbi:hypothetical protein C9414_19935, partial [Bacillus sp. Nf3]
GKDADVFAVVWDPAGFQLDRAIPEALVVSQGLDAGNVGAGRQPGGMIDLATEEELAVGQSDATQPNAEDKVLGDRGDCVLLPVVYLWAGRTVVFEDVVGKAD